ncbi:hypothetical protein FOZ63_032457 [Perkinsus olseni]|uniref:EF-hand domain-containing protein n=1 Tax=Perkinsus olseni TaxID=32597 RepID=A0A7J6NZ50_PEROL|nr:hypothetical protein FOZ63_032457 [Perkinsus olseni]KAF4712472.1 hypothetical protein FOZ62_010017 [Perkinsus olseni]
MTPDDIQGLQQVHPEEFPIEQEHRCVHGLVKRKRMSEQDALEVYQMVVVAIAWKVYQTLQCLLGQSEAGQVPWGGHFAPIGGYHKGTASVLEKEALERELSKISATLRRKEVELRKILKAHGDASAANKKLEGALRERHTNVERLRDAFKQKWEEAAIGEKQRAMESLKERVVAQTKLLEESRKRKRKLEGELQRSTHGGINGVLLQPVDDGHFIQETENHLPISGKSPQVEVDSLVMSTDSYTSETSEEKVVVPKLPIPMRQVSERNGPVEDPSVLDAFLIPGIQENLFTNEQIVEAFRSIDSDGNGYLDESDVSYREALSMLFIDGGASVRLRQVLALSGETVTNEEIQEMIRMVDNNGSGYVNYREFAELFLKPSLLFRNVELEERTKQRMSLWDYHAKYEYNPDFEVEFERAVEHRESRIKEARFVGGLTRDSRRDILTAFTESEAGSSVKPSQIKKIFHKFQEIDKDGSGMIDYEEFRKALLKEDTPMLRRLFAIFDTDGSGEIDVKEFIVGLSTYTDAPPKDKLKFAFMMFDEDGSGFIDKAELLKILRANSPERRAEVLYGEVKLPVGAKISMEKFTELAESNPQLLIPAFQELREIDTTLDDGAEEGSIEPPIRGRPSLFIFDWDDTLFPTTAFLEQSTLDEAEADKAEAAFLSCLEAAGKVLREAVDMSRGGKVHIVTAADPAWVYKCARRSSSGILPLIGGINPRVEVKSTIGLASKARSMARALESRRQRVDEGHVSLVLVGNSRCDLNPARLLSRLLPRSYVKCVKMKSVPSVDDLSKQLSKLRSVLPRIVAEESHKTYVMCPEEARAMKSNNVVVKQPLPGRSARGNVQGNGIRQRLHSDASTSAGSGVDDA